MAEYSKELNSCIPDAQKSNWRKGRLGAGKLCNMKMMNRLIDLTANYKLLLYEFSLMLAFAARPGHENNTENTFLLVSHFP